MSTHDTTEGSHPILKSLARRKRSVSRAHVGMDGQEKTGLHKTTLAKRDPLHSYEKPGTRLANRLTEIDERAGAEHGSGFEPPLIVPPEDRTALEVVRIASAIAEGDTEGIVASLPAVIDGGRTAKQQAFQALVMQSSRVQSQIQARSQMVAPSVTSPERDGGLPMLDDKTGERALEPIRPPEMGYAPAHTQAHQTTRPESHNETDKIGSGMGSMPAILQYQPETYAPELKNAPPKSVPATARASHSRWSEGRPAAFGILGGLAFAGLVGGAIFGAGELPFNGLQQYFDTADVAAVRTAKASRTARSAQTAEEQPVQSPDVQRVTEVKTLAVDPTPQAEAGTANGAKTIAAVSGRAFTLPVTLAEGSSGEAKNGFVRVDNLPAGSRLSVGRRIEDRSWIVPETQADQILAIVTLNSIAQQATHDIVVQHTGADRVTPLGPLQTFRLTVTKPATQAAGAPAAAKVVAQTDEKVLTQTQVRSLILLGNRLMRGGKVAEAREKFAEATLSNVAEADLAMGQAYDAHYLRSVNANAQPNEKRARFWYRKAAEKGSLTATRKLERMGKG